VDTAAPGYCPGLYAADVSFVIPYVLFFIFDTRLMLLLDVVDG
jgi:hypothetical protein